MEEGVQRWAVNISNWKPSSHHFLAAMSVLPGHEHSSITRFVKLEDRIRALVSRLLQYALVHKVLGIPVHEIIIRRTPEGKPFLVSDNMKLRFKNFNYNVSHHGDYAAIASEPICLVGLDIVSHYIPVTESACEFINSFLPYFSSSEWCHIFKASSSDEMLKVFYKYWCLKEAFVKAIGSGVGYKLDSVEFHHENWDNISVKIGGKELQDWKFWLLELGPNHSHVRQILYKIWWFASPWQGRLDQGSRFSSLSRLALSRGGVRRSPSRLEVKGRIEARRRRKLPPLLLVRGSPASPLVVKIKGCG
ncbi:Unknown protein [Striga hermonthica]|uniref:holo-[acyl-carrier-protein] synthase n=1 Tax=Striga hermonthica TaxID=68872 RepID=A0A9N7NF14_STRHE|nr:Unknown protein [Striga hermonthica]